MLTRETPICARHPNAAPRRNQCRPEKGLAGNDVGLSVSEATTCKNWQLITRLSGPLLPPRGGSTPQSFTGSDRIEVLPDDFRHDRMQQPVRGEDTRLLEEQRSSGGSSDLAPGFLNN